MPNLTFEKRAVRLKLWYNNARKTTFVLLDGLTLSDTVRRLPSWRLLKKDERKKLKRSIIITTLKFLTWKDNHCINWSIKLLLWQCLEEQGNRQRQQLSSLEKKKPSSRDIPATQLLSSRDVPATLYLSSRDVPARQLLSSREVPARQYLSTRDLPGGQQGWIE